MPDEQILDVPQEAQSPAAAVPGWYLDGTDVRRRYWDGTGWTEQYEEPKTGRVKKTRKPVPFRAFMWFVSSAAILGLILGSMIGAGGSSTDSLRTQLADSKKTEKILQGNLEATQAAQADVDTKSAALDKRSADLDTREAAIKATETTVAANTFAGDGLYIVGKDIQAGQYKSAGGSNCYWARRNASGDNIIDNSLGSGPSVVTVKPTDGLLEVSGCAPFTKVG